MEERPGVADLVPPRLVEPQAGKSRLVALLLVALRASVALQHGPITVTDNSPRSKICITDKGDTFLLYASITAEGVCGSVDMYYYGKQPSPAPPQCGE